MSPPITLRFDSRLRSSREALWAWITSVEGINRETMPWLRMTAPAGVASLADLQVVMGSVLFRSRILYAGFLPLDHSDLTLIEWTPPEGFVERSPMRSMRSWQHERRIGTTDHESIVMLSDTLTFEPRIAALPSRWLVRRFFLHRHAVLRAVFDGHGDGPRTT